MSLADSGPGFAAFDGFGLPADAERRLRFGGIVQRDGRESVPAGLPADAERRLRCGGSVQREGRPREWNDGTFCYKPLLRLARGLIR